MYFIKISPSSKASLESTLSLISFIMQTMEKYEVILDFPLHFRNLYQI